MTISPTIVVAPKVIKLANFASKFWEDINPTTFAVMSIRAVFFAIFLLGVISCDKGSGDKNGNSIELEANQEPVFSEFDSSTIHQIDSFFLASYSSGIFNGNVLLYKQGKLFTSSYGVKNYQTKEPLNDSCKFQLASVSKPFTATVIMQLVEKGLVHLSDTVNQILPEFPYPGITVEMLLCHRSGLSNYMYITDSIWMNQEIPMCNENLLDSLIGKNPPAYYPPNYTFNYSNTNYFLLAAIAEKVMGMNFESIIASQLFDPSELRYTFVGSNMNMPKMENIAWGSENGKWHIADYYLNGVTGDKGVFSTTFDLLKFHMALQSGTILNDSLVQEMYVPRSNFNSKGGSYGLGWRLKAAHDHYPRVVYHLGWWRGYRSYFIRVPESDIAIIILSNLVRGPFLSQEELLDLVL
jgi:CubicO group peptidase (beta-lactamase class C family)